jgi:hypothetical protein
MDIVLDFYLTTDDYTHMTDAMLAGLNPDTQAYIGEITTILSLLPVFTRRAALAIIEDRITRAGQDGAELGRVIAARLRVLEARGAVTYAGALRVCQASTMQVCGGDL